MMIDLDQCTTLDAYPSLDGQSGGHWGNIDRSQKGPKASAVLTSKEDVLPHGDSKDFWAFVVSEAAVGRLCSGRLSAPTGSWSVTGFGVMESPDRRGSQPRERIPRQGGCRSTLLCALRPWLREADAVSTLSTGLACCTLNPPPKSSLTEYQIPNTLNRGEATVRRMIENSSCVTA
jgi:hypothetical protein